MFAAVQTETHLSIYDLKLPWKVVSIWFAKIGFRAIHDGSDFKRAVQFQSGWAKSQILIGSLDTAFCTVFTVSCWHCNDDENKAIRSAYYRG